MGTSRAIGNAHETQLPSSPSSLAQSFHVISMALGESDSEARPWFPVRPMLSVKADDRDAGGAEQKQPRVNFFSAYHLTAAIPPCQ